MKALVSIAASLWLLASPAAAEVTVGQYRTGLREAPETWRTYFKGLLDGMAWANAGIEAGDPKLYCEPENFVLTRSQAENIMFRFIERISIIDDDTYLALALLLALQDMFPCDNQ